ncbi:hypothetical protein MB02_12625 [Croceicoccus estronivorus]|uniref:TetR/AcrR family transcriptional regulator n=1 Tax=Croceicoccus estronivorus TaxID=1172626 RepID=UPI00082D87A5|nr:TetR/AcrR family transcriptional regulator [Croceicoccus estronivorus]OCC23445.1 hypothetical protein MB02_12625 [Croceicoccus estronivorus]
MMNAGDADLRQGRRTRMAPAERRALILAAASDMFQRHGYAGASIDAIAAASGISGPGIYRYFSGKTELLLALLEAAVDEAMDAIETATASDPALEGPERLADVLADHAMSKGAIITLLQGTVADMEAMDKSRLERLRGDAVGRLAQALTLRRGSLSIAEAEGRIVAALAVVGQAERFLATGANENSFRMIVRAILRL